MNKYDNNNRDNKNSKDRPIYKDYDIFPGRIRLIKDNGQTIVIDRDVAIEMAKNSGKNLVQVNYNKNNDPRTTCKIYDFSKMKYEQKKREKDAARKSRIANAEAHEVVFSIRIDDGDYNRKVRQIRDFIVDDNARVKITIKLSKREATNVKYMAVDMMKKILSNYNDIAVLDNSPSDNGCVISCTLRPSKNPR